MSQETRRTARDMGHGVGITFDVQGEELKNGCLRRSTAMFGAFVTASFELRVPKGTHL
jgi:hypothetical protein